MSNLGNMLVALGEDHTTLSHFATDPEAVMDHFGLSDDEKTAVRSADIDTLKAAHPNGQNLLILAPQNLLILARESNLLILGHGEGAGG